MRIVVWLVVWLQLRIFAPSLNSSISRSCIYLFDINFLSLINSMPKSYICTCTKCQNHSGPTGRSIPSSTWYDHQKLERALGSNDPSSSNSASRPTKKTRLISDGPENNEDFEDQYNLNDSGTPSARQVYSDEGGEVQNQEKLEMDHEYQNVGGDDEENNNDFDENQVSFEFYTVQVGRT